MNSQNHAPNTVLSVEPAPQVPGFSVSRGLVHFRRSLTRYGVALAVCVIAVTALAAAGSALRKPVYEAQSVLMLRDVVGGEDPRVPTPATATTLLLDPDVLRSAIGLAGLSGAQQVPGPEQLARDSVRLRDIGGTRFLEVTVRLADRDAAVRLANAIPTAALSFQDGVSLGVVQQRARQLEAALKRSTARLDQLTRDLSTDDSPASRQRAQLMAQLRTAGALLQDRERERDDYRLQGRRDPVRLGELESAAARARARVSDLATALAQIPADGPAPEIYARWRMARKVYEDLLRMDEMQRAQPTPPIFSVTRQASTAVLTSPTRMQAAMVGAVISALISLLLLAFVTVKSMSEPSRPR